jgi:hypothetical protein
MFGVDMKTLRVLLLISSALAIFSCAYGTATYGPVRTIRSDFMDPENKYGYSEVQLDSITYQVSFADPSAAEAERFALYRSAEITNQHGFDYFAVTDSRDDGNSVIKTIRMYKGDTPTDNPSAYNAKSMLAVMGPTINK